MEEGVCESFTEEEELQMYFRIVFYSSQGLSHMLMTEASFFYQISRLCWTRSCDSQAKLAIINVDVDVIM